ncbi:MAG: EAL domain-containing protein [Rhodospirillaceae bacterium]|nr:EAL domain-containing protein [Rhodospirillaceae bacterium]
MPSEIPLDQAGSAEDLLLRLHAMASPPIGVNALLIVSLSMLPLNNAPEEFWADFRRALVEFRDRHNVEVFELAYAERGFLAKLDEYNLVRINSDLKVTLLRLIQEYFPENFGMVDQTRLVAIFDLRQKMATAIKIMERLVDAGDKPAQEQSQALRRLQEEDIALVVGVNEQLGPEQFAKVFIRHQKIAAIKPGQAPQQVMHEYFVGMDMLKKHVFKKVELRGSGNLFNQLTLTLDKLLVEAYDAVNPSGAKCSINLNVESVFTKAFQDFMGDDDYSVFANLVFEFRQANILQHFDEFGVAAELIRSRGGTIAVDAVFPETVGVVNLSRLNANIAKIFWRNGAESVLPQFRDEIAAMQAAGTVVVLARLDDELGLQVAHDLGIQMFQGFYVDDLLAAQAKAG